MRSTSWKCLGMVAVVALGVLGGGTGRSEAKLFGRRRVAAQEVVVAPPTVLAPPPVVMVPNRIVERRKGILFLGRRRALARVPAVIVSPTPIAADPVVQPPTVVEGPAVESPAVESPVVESPVANPAAPEPRLDLPLPAEAEPIQEPEPLIKSRVAPQPR